MGLSLQAPGGEHVPPLSHPGVRELGCLYTNSHQSLVEGQVWGWGWSGGRALSVALGQEKQEVLRRSGQRSLKC